MKRIIIINLALWLLASCNQMQDIGDVALSPDWRFSPGNDLAWAQPGFDDSGWTTVSCSDTWENQGFEGLDGYGWYRQTITLPENFRKPVEKYGGLVISYDNADDSDALYFNGQIIAKTGDFPPEYVSAYGQKRRHVIPFEYINTEGPNTIAIQVYDGGGNGGIVTSQVIMKPLSPASKIAMTCDIVPQDWVFLGDAPKTINVTLSSQENSSIKCSVLMEVMTDKYEPAQTLQMPYKVKAQESLTKTFNLDLTRPGFYRCRLTPVINGFKGEPVQFNIGFEPEKIESPVDAQPDFTAFWEGTRAQLDQVPMNAKMTLLKEFSTGARDLYYVEMRSFGNETIGGYYATPRAKGKYPAIIVYMGYGSVAWMPHTDGEPGFATFVVSTRGQGIFMPGNKYGKWICYGIEDKDTYYYRGAFMDLVRAVDFVCSRPEIDNTKIVAEGGSQGGAFTMAACALDHRIAVAAPTIPFLSDYRDYFEIVQWPGSDIHEYMNNHPEAKWDDVFKVLSYFDIKNLAPWISCPVIMAAGLQDETCPPHTNFAGYNQITSEKEYRIYKDYGHNTPPEWQQVRMDFIKKHLNIQ